MMIIIIRSEGSCSTPVMLKQKGENHLCLGDTRTSRHPFLHVRRTKERDGDTNLEQPNQQFRVEEIELAWPLARTLLKDSLWCVSSQRGGGKGGGGSFSEGRKPWECWWATYLLTWMEGEARFRPRSNTLMVSGSIYGRGNCPWPLTAFCGSNGMVRTNGCDPLVMKSFKCGIEMVGLLAPLSLSLGSERFMAMGWIFVNRYWSNKNIGNDSTSERVVGLIQR